VAGETFTPKQIVRRALQGLAIPRVATGPLAVHCCARWAGKSLREYSTDPAVLADCVLRYYEQFQPDAVWISADTWVSAQAMGAAVAFPGGDQPLGGDGTVRIRTFEDVAAIPPPDPASQGRWPMMLEALRTVVEALGDRVFVVACFDQYPFSLACALMGIERLMFSLWDNRPLVEALLERCTEYTVAYARAMAEAGADMLSGGDSPAGLIGPALYRDVALPFEKKVIAALRAECGVPISLHICGNAAPILPDMADTGADVFELDHQVDLSAACRILGPNAALWGNLDPVGLLAQGDAERVRAAAEMLLRTVQDSGHRRFVLSSGCTLAVDTPPENLRAMLDAARRFGPLAACQGACV
jgi:uroporphyrinogen decarboxylase